MPVPLVGDGSSPKLTSPPGALSFAKALATSPSAAPSTSSSNQPNYADDPRWNDPQEISKKNGKKKVVLMSTGANRKYS